MQRSRAVGFIVHEPHALFLEDPNIGAIMLGANTVLSSADLQMVTLVTDSARDVERVTRYLSGGFVDGVIIVSARANDPITRSIERARLPAAFVGHPPDLGTIPYVGIDNTASARAVTERLLATGRRRIGIIAAALDRDSGTDRLTGFRAALGDRYDPDLVVEVPLYEFNAGLHGTLELLRRATTSTASSPPPTPSPQASSQACAARDAPCPTTSGVVGFDDSSWALRCYPPLSTVHQPAAGLGERAAELVVRQLAGVDVPPGGTILSSPVVWRESA